LVESSVLSALILCLILFFFSFLIMNTGFSLVLPIGVRMKCPNCYFENQRNKNVCENSSSDLHPPQPLSAADPSLTPGFSQVPRSRDTRAGGSRFLR
jgi:hypothetical protein